MNNVTEVKYIRDGNIFNSHAQAYVNPVNTLGISGAGLAKQFALKYPNNHKLYRKACHEKLCDIGLCYLVPNNNQPEYIINFPTKQHFKDPSQLEYIQAGMVSLLNLIDVYKIHSIAIPPLGCGLGGLNQDIVIPLIINPIWKKRGVVLEMYV